MRRGSRSAVIGAICICALAACSHGGDQASATVFNPSQLSQAMPSKLGAPHGWRGSEPVVYQGSEALKYCGYQELACSGVTAMGNSHYEAQNSEADSGPRLRFTLLAYDGDSNAKAGMKGLVASVHKQDAKSKALSIQSWADETDAYTTGDSSSAVMRVGTVVAYVAGVHVTKPADLQKFAKLQVERIKTAAGGKNPDA